MGEKTGQVATEVQRKDEPPQAFAEAAFVLTVTAGPDRGRTFRLETAQPTRVLIGTSPACEIRLTDRQVSRRHAALDRVGAALRLTDLGSTNGTLVDRVKIHQADLQGDEVVRIGTTMLRATREVAHEVALPAASAFGKLGGASREMRRLYPLCERLAPVDLPVLLEGETGTGKEVLAESLHERGPRADGPFVVFDCSSVPPNLVEAELFGFERGAFTGAEVSRAGVFEQAHGGTLLIDEVGELDPMIQPKLLRALERREVRRVGGKRVIAVDFRLLAATRRDLDREVQAGRFRDDLYHRLAVARIALPPLRDRQGDVRLLAEQFWTELGGAGPFPHEWLLRWDGYLWPGNVRELRNAVARFIALGELSHADPLEALSVGATTAGLDTIEGLVQSGLPYPQARDRLMDQFDERYVAWLLAKHGDNVAKAAEASGIGRRYFQKLKARTTR
jgi:two-component system, NtrC family, response regulator HydG